MTPAWEILTGDPNLLLLKALIYEVAELSLAVKLDLSRYPFLADLDWFERVLHRVSSTFTLIVIGQVSVGKSSFINSLFGRKLLLLSDRPTDEVLSVLLAADQGEPEHAEKILRDGLVERFVSLDKAMRFLRQQDTPSEQQFNCSDVQLYLHKLALFATHPDH
ncbi:dynamin family protein [Pelotomaculum propionicicum]|uniref:Dynamin N-terminal domain-containing protein n=1 Tax=Pelotomaculum propionicicum TaxID=258475 RepID=A0A4Y7RNT4_9FIRM|nr:dynamin family protein [Pelotomaculum propionicicum]TEB10635.1 hypothetical protein Pmgp_02215 [Pelotomaculum propionicicum]